MRWGHLGQKLFPSKMFLSARLHNANVLVSWFCSILKVKPRKALPSSSSSFGQVRQSTEVRARSGVSRKRQSHQCPPLYSRFLQLLGHSLLCAFGFVAGRRLPFEHPPSRPCEGFGVKGRGVCMIRHTELACRQLGAQRHTAGHRSAFWAPCKL